MTAFGLHKDPAALPLRGCFVAGTDTGVGKTVISAGLLQLLGRRPRAAIVAPHMPAGARKDFHQGAAQAVCTTGDEDVIRHKSGCAALSAGGVKQVGRSARVG